MAGFFHPFPGGPWIMRSAACIIPDGARWQEEWLADYQTMEHHPLRARTRFLVGLLLGAPRLAWTLRQHPDQE
jgi:hypothetical protein